MESFQPVALVRPPPLRPEDVAFLTPKHRGIVFAKLCCASFCSALGVVMLLLLVIVVCGATLRYLEGPDVPFPEDVSSVSWDDWDYD